MIPTEIHGDTNEELKDVGENILASSEEAAFLIATDDNFNPEDEELSEERPGSPYKRKVDKIFEKLYNTGRVVSPKKPHKVKECSMTLR